MCYFYLFIHSFAVFAFVICSFEVESHPYPQLFNYSLKLSILRKLHSLCLYILYSFFMYKSLSIIGSFDIKFFNHHQIAHSTVCFFS